MPRFCRRIGTFSAGGLWLTWALLAPAVAADPSWYSDIQYLTWDVRADEAEAAQADAGDGEIYLQPSEAERNCGWYESSAGGGNEFCSCDDGCEMPLCGEWQCRMQCLCQQMHEQGIAYNVVVPQFYQGVTSGGNDRVFEYGGKIDQFLTLDGTKLGWWPGMTMTLHAETRYGEDVNFEAVGLAPVNVAMLYPNVLEHETAITGLSFANALSDEVLVTYGKFNSLDLFYQLYPETGRGVNTFMNASMVIPLALARVFPLSFMGAGVMTVHGAQVESSLLVYDPHNVATTSGFDELGDNGANIMGFRRIFTNVGGLPGSTGVGVVGGTGTFVAFQSEGFIIVPNQGVVLPTQRGTWAVFGIEQQTLWTDGCNPERKIGLLSQWCLADEHTCPYRWTGNIGLQGQGLVRSRPQDTLGAAYFYNGLSDEFVNLLSPVRQLHDVHGVELYYNAAVAKHFALTSDLQVIEPADVTNDTAVVFGLRGTAAF